MKKTKFILILIFTLFLFDSFAQKNMVEFEKYFNELPQLEFPLIFNSNKLIKFDFPQTTMNTKIVWGLRVDIGFTTIGKLYETDIFYAIVGIISNDIGSPLIITVDKNDNGIDKFFGYKTAQYDMGYYRSNFIKISRDMKIQLTDSLLTRKIMEDGSDEIPGTDSLSVIETNFIITEDGKIKTDR